MTRQRLTLVTPPAPGAIAQSVRDFLDDKRASGASPKTTATYRDVLEQVLLPHLAASGVTDVTWITSVVLNGLTSGLLTGSASRSGPPLSKASASSYGRTINVFLAWAAEQTGIAQTAKTKLPRVGKRPWTPWKGRKCSAWKTPPTAIATS